MTIEEQYPGITEQIRKYAEAEVPPCPHCHSTNTVTVLVGVVGRTMLIVQATRKATLVANVKDKLGKYFCNECRKFFD